VACGFLERLVGSEHHVHGTVEQERQFIAQHRQLRVAGDPQH
jgi:hypothetical protein